MKKRKLFTIIILVLLFFGIGLRGRAFSLTTDELKEKAMVIAMQEAEKKMKVQETSSPPMKINVEAPSKAKEESMAPPIEKGAWTLNKGQIYIELYTKYYWHNHQFDDKGHKREWNYEGKYNELRTELKLEYGLTDRYTFLLYTVAKEAHWKDAFASYTKRGFVEIWPGAKYLLFSSPFICSLQGRAKFPFGYNEHDIPALGRHQIDEEFKILTAQPWPKLPGYTKFEAGYRARNEEPADEIPYFFEFGYSLTKNIILKATLDGQEGLKPTGSSPETWIKGSCGPIVKISDFLNVECGYGNTFYGKNTSAAQEIYLSLSSQW